MNVVRIAAAFVFAGLATSAFAGPDWDVIQRARLAAHQANATAAENQAMKEQCKQMMHPMSSSDTHAHWMSKAIDSHGTTTDSDTVSNRAWGNALASVLGERSPYLDGSRIDQRNVFTDGALSMAGMDRTGPLAPPAHTRDPYTDGARASDMSSLA
ncbi:hypothetical protein [Cupriavidus pauculus]|uniref:hypothetical protein n=1 Tax=Cupriavidus pauculus TaxID=82633 RepID=UPI001EE2462C|nr:hypothetical protein [Cupriavidus pauculus]GJG98225.1 hypothetical protein CBA19C6_27070 [Cupriavidus pauculus]